MRDYVDRLIELRKAQGVTQRALADALGVTVRTIQYYESREKKPDFDNLVRMAEFFDVSIDYLAGKTDDPRPMNPVVREIVENQDPEKEFARWVEENVSATFFYDFYRSPEESKAQLMRDLRMVWEYERKKR